MSGMNKRPAYMHAKEFKLPKILGNLQAYKIATGQVSKEELDEVSKKYGSDEGAVFGSLITDASGRKPSDCDEAPPKKRRKRKKRRRSSTMEKKSPTSAKPSTQPKMGCPSDEPLTIPASLLGEHSSDSGDSQTSPQASSSEGSEDCDDEVPGSFFGLLPGGDEVQEPPVTCSSAPGCTLEVQSSSSQMASDSQRSSPAPAGVSPSWDSEKLKFRSEVSNLSTYKCFRCRRVGHLAQDCTAFSPSAAAAGVGGGQRTYTKRLKDYYHKCRKLREVKAAACVECGASSNLASCLECGLALCDGRGHLVGHLSQHPSHTKLYSHKLQRQVKCCKATCEVMDADQLFACSSCLDKAFNSHYSLVNATWSRAGLKAIPNALACDEHFHWHRMNCPNPSQDPLVSHQDPSRDGLLSEFFF